MALFKVWSEDKLNKKFVVAEKMTLWVFKRASFTDVLKCLRYQEIREMINRRTKYKEVTSSSHWEVSAAVKGVFEYKYEFQQKYNLFYLQNDMVTCMFFEYNINK